MRHPIRCRAGRVATYWEFSNGLGRRQSVLVGNRLVRITEYNEPYGTLQTRKAVGLMTVCLALKQVLPRQSATCSGQGRHSKRKGEYQ